MNKLFVLVGLQGSGKSTFAEEYKNTNENIEIVSSDAIREENNWEIDNNKVFDIFYKRINEFLKNGKDVIADATNITIKARRQLFEKVKVESEKIAVVFNVPIGVCRSRLIKRNESSTRKVPIEVLEKYHKSFQIPFYEEGFNQIILIKEETFSSSFHKSVLNLMEGFNQRSKYHDYDLYKHSLFVEIGVSASVGFPVYSGLYHDIGKLFTQAIDENDEAHYYNHENVGAYYVLSHPELATSKEHLLDLCFIINYHMMPFGWKTDKALDKWTRIFGKEEVIRLCLFNEFDKNSAKKVVETNEQG